MIAGSLLLQAVRCQLDKLAAARGRQVAEVYTLPPELSGPLGEWFQGADPNLKVYRVLIFFKQLNKINYASVTLGWFAFKSYSLLSSRLGTSSTVRQHSPPVT